MMKRRVGTLALVWLSAGCVLQTQTIEGDQADAGPAGESGGSPFSYVDPVAKTDIYYNGGNVGIGTSAPAAMLEMSSAAKDAAQIHINQTNTVSGEEGGLVWQGYYSGTTTLFGAAAIKRVNVEDNNGPTNSQRLGFFVREPVVDGALVERMCVRENGNVGIGTTSPVATLDVVSDNPVPFSVVTSDDVARIHMEGALGTVIRATADDAKKVMSIQVTKTADTGAFLSLFGADNSGGVVLGTARTSDTGMIYLETNGKNSMVVAASGNVGIGTTSPAERLHVNGNILATGTIKAMNFPDLAENITAADPLIGPGDVVASDPSGGERIVLATGPYARTLLGVISTHPGILLNGDPADLETKLPRDPRQRALALAGRVPVKVTLEGGPIRPGDPLTSSSTPGRAMRATEPWRGGVLGTALTVFDGKDESGKVAAEGKVIAFLSLDRTPSCDPEAQARLASKVGELEGKLASERDARLALEARLQALEAAMARPAEAQRRGR